jgi:hypothetical protein
MTETRRAHVERWITDYLQRRHPEMVPQMRQCVAAFDEAMVSGRLSQENLRIILDSVQIAKPPVGENAAYLLGELSSKFPAAERAIRDMSSHRNVHVRRNALVAVSSTGSLGLLDDVLRVSLRDRSASIRALAADKIGSFRRKNLVGDLEDRLHIERSATTRELMHRELQLLRDGYQVCERADGLIWISYRLPNGGTGGRFVSKQDLEQYGPRAIAIAEGADS